MKEIKEYLRYLGFHHSWGYWVYGGDKRLKFRIYKGHKYFSLEFSFNNHIEKIFNYEKEYANDSAKFEMFKESIFEKLLNYIK